MNLYQTEIHAICPVTERIKVYSGPKIPAESYSEAVRWCQENQHGYCRVVGRFIEETPANTTFNKMQN